ncbi:BnaC02g31360D [Brassica napus]|uniref:BnaC02g31360D protein n=1 Tax=Brassica napus TaxID=3708 RepID=A0A078HED3_BRANA|nr:BnaC02g31360D [Brassica napus]
MPGGHYKLVHMIGIGLVNNVPRATSAYAAARQEDSQLCVDLTAANNVIALLWEEQDDMRAQLRAMERMFDVIASGNPEIMWAWDSVRQFVHRVPTLEE